MKKLITLTLLTLLSASLVFGQGGTGPGTGPGGLRSADFSQDYTTLGSGVMGGSMNLTGSITGTGSIATTVAIQGIKHATVTISSADLLALYSAPKLLIAAPGAGHSIEILKANFAITRTSTAYITGGGAAIIQYDSTTHGGGTQACDSTIAATVITGSAGLSNTFRDGAIISDATTTVDNKGVYFSAATGDFTAGTGTAVMDIWYVVN